MILVGSHKRVSLLYKLLLCAPQCSSIYYIPEVLLEKRKHFSKLQRQRTKQRIFFYKLSILWQALREIQL